MDFQAPILAEYETISIEDAAIRVIDAAVSRLKETSKLIVALGENHLTTSHRLLASQVLNGLVERGIPVTFAIEEEENVIPTFLRDTMGMDISDIPDALWNGINELDTDGHIRAKTILCMSGDLGTLPLEIAVNHKLTVLYADAARKKEDELILLDLNDPKTRIIAQDLYGELPDDMKLAAASIGGVHIRNHFMLRSCTRTPGFSTVEPHVVLLQTGRAHIQGSDTDNSLDALVAAQEGLPRPSIPYEESLAGIAAVNDIPFMGACLTSPAGIMNGVQSRWYEGTFYFELPGNLATDTPDPDPEATKARKLVYMNESVGVVAGLITLGRAIGKPAPAAPSP